MRIVFVSNKLTPHQIPICDAFYNSNCDFSFIETMDEKVVEIGWMADATKYSYVIPFSGEKEWKNRIINLVEDADVVIIGSADDSFIISRLKLNKLTFKYSERWYKNGLNIKNIGRAFIGSWLHHGRFQKYPLYMLCASAYTPCDCMKFQNYKNRLFKWGYFPETRKYEVNALLKLKRDNPIPLIVWAGRLLEWKHPEISVYLASKLKQKGYRFQLTIIGKGEMEETLNKMILALNLEDCVTMMGQKSPEEVREYMEKAHIFLFTSDYREGWGAVLNESMNSGCAVVANHAIGAVPFLISNGENGYVYENNNMEELYQKVAFLLENSERREHVGINAYKTMIETWNAENAAKRFVQLAEKLLAAERVDQLYQDGPCSTADVIQQIDMYQYILDKGSKTENA